MVTLEPKTDVFTLVNVFAVTPETQQQVLDLLEQAGPTMQALPGFVSSTLHKSYDGKQVVNYVQWRSRADFEAMQKNPQAVPHMQATAQLAQSYNPILCEVIWSVNN